MNYQVVTFDGSSDDVREQSPVLTYDYANPGLDFVTDPTANSVTYVDLPGGTIAANINQSAYAANHSQGTLLHQYNATGVREQIVPGRWRGRSPSRRPRTRPSATHPSP